MCLWPGVPREAREDQSHLVCESFFHDEPSQHLLYRAGRIGQRSRRAGQHELGSPDSCRLTGCMEVAATTRACPFS